MCQSGKDAQQALIKSLHDKIEELEKANRELSALVDYLQERNKILVLTLFGPSSEKSATINPEASPTDKKDAADTPGDAANDSPNDAELESDPDAESELNTHADPMDKSNDPAEGGDAQKAAKKKAKRRPGGGRKPLSKKLPRVITVLEYEKKCSVCHSPMRIIGEHSVEKLAVLPALYYVIQNIHKHTACPCCDDQITCAPAEPSLIPNSQATPELLAHIAIGKTADALPIYRQEKQAARSDCPISRDKLNRWFINLGMALIPFIKLLADAYNTHHIGGIDETRLQVIQEAGKTAYQLSYLFIRYGGPLKKPVMLVDYARHKNQEMVDKLLEPFEGKGLISDMYSAFIAFVKKTAGIVLYACHDHARRKFVDALKLVPKVQRQTHIAGRVLELYKQLYESERQVKGRPPDLIKKRRCQSRKILNQIYEIIESVSVRPKSTLGKAIDYAIRHKAALYAYLDNPLAPISNIKTEHVAKKIAVARKNFLFCMSEQGAQALANVMTVVYTAEMYPEHNLHDYLTILFAELPKAQTMEDLEALLPCNLSPEEVSRRILLRPRPSMIPLSQAA